MPIPDQQLYDIITKSGLIEKGDLDKAQTSSKGAKKSLYDALLDLDLISDANLGKVIAESFNLPFVSLKGRVIPRTLVNIIPEQMARINRIIPFEETPDVIRIASSGSDVTTAIKTVAKKAGRRAEIHFATDRDIDEALNLYKSGLGIEVSDLLKKAVSEKADMPIIEVVKVIIENAYDLKASDIHIEPLRDESVIRFRIDGILKEAIRITKALHDQIVTRIKVESKLRTDEHSNAQDGKMIFSLPREELDIRVSVVPVVEGEGVVLRLLSARSRQFGLSDLGMGKGDLEKVQRAYQKPFGMVLSTGPTGSGKTTTIYSILKILNTRERNIDTVEDPVEYELEGINQIQVNTKTNLTFAEGLKSILRQDPDIIYVGEIRDDETAGIAINSAMTGHLVLSTLHTNDAAGTFPRLIDMHVEPFLVASTVNVVIAQRLVRKICTSCRVSKEMNLDEITKVVGVDLVNKHFPQGEKVLVYHGKGCPVCGGTGYLDRVGLFEVLEVTEDIKNLIIAKADSDAIQAKGVSEGMSTILEDGISKVQQGITTLEEVLRVTAQ